MWEPWCKPPGTADFMGVSRGATDGTEDGRTEWRGLPGGRTAEARGAEQVGSAWRGRASGGGYGTLLGSLWSSQTPGVAPRLRAILIKQFFIGGGGGLVLPLKRHQHLHHRGV